MSVYCPDEVAVTVPAIDRATVNRLHMPLSGLSPCQSCGCSAVSIFHSVSHIPMHRVLLLPTHEAALHYPQYPLRLGFCHQCGFIANVAFDATAYSNPLAAKPDYSIAGHSPPLADVAAYLIEHYDVRNSHVIEIGGGGHLLRLLCELGNNLGIGLDLQHTINHPTNGAVAHDSLRCIHDIDTEQCVVYRARLICCRMTLEHIARVGEFVEMMRRMATNQLDTLIYVEVPNVLPTLEATAFWDISYEHCSYFTPGSLARLFRRQGFDVLELRTMPVQRSSMLVVRLASGHNQFFPDLEDDMRLLKQAVRSFSRTFGEKLAWWKPYLQSARLMGERTVVWGAGAQTAAFLVTLGIRHEVRYVVDSNPARHGCYLAGTGQQIVSPLFLRDYRPDTIIVTDRACRYEIERNMRSLGLCPDIMMV